MKPTFFKGLVLGVVMAAALMVPTAAFAGSGIGGVFNLGESNSVNATTGLTGSTAGRQLQVTNTDTGSGATGIGIKVASGIPPLRVNSSTQVPNLNASFLRGKAPANFYAAGSTVANSNELGGVGPTGYYAAGSTVANSNELGGVGPTGYYAAGSTVANSDRLGGVGAASYQQACSHGTVIAFGQVPAAANFSSTFTSLTNAFNCDTGEGVLAKRVNTGDYRFLVCGIFSEPFALGTDQSFNDFVSVQFMQNSDADAQSACGGVGSWSEFKVTSRDANGNAQDNPFTVAQL